MPTEIPAPSPDAPPPLALANGSKKPSFFPKPGQLKPNKPKSMTDRLGWVLVIAATTLVVILALALFMLDSIQLYQLAGPVVLDKEYVSPTDNFSICGPINWPKEEDVSGNSLVIKGPSEKGQGPVVLVSFDIAPGRLVAYAEEHKKRLEHEDPTLKWLSEEDTWIGGTHVIRLEYECQYKPNEEQSAVGIRVLVYLYDAKPRFYRVMCYSADTCWERYSQKLEACAETFLLKPIPVPNVNYFTK